MYHIKNDKRCEKSAELITEAVYELIKTKPLSEITVTEIQEKSTVGRSTFYRNFDTVNDVLVMESDNECRGMARAYREAAEQSKNGSGAHVDLIRFFFNYWNEHREIIKILIKVGRMDIFNASMLAVYDEIADIGFPGLDRNSDEYSYFITMKMSIGTGILTKLITDGETKSTDEIMQILQRSFMAAAKYLFSDLKI